MKLKIITRRFFVATFTLLIAQVGVAEDKKQKPLRALLITGGCCHNYIFQSKALIDGVAKHVIMAATTGDQQSPQWLLFFVFSNTDLRNQKSEGND